MEKINDDLLKPTKSIRAWNYDPENNIENCNSNINQAGY